MNLKHLSTAQVLATPAPLADPTRPTIIEALSAEFHRTEIFGIEVENWYEVSPTVLGINLVNAETLYIAADKKAHDVADGVPYFQFFMDEELLRTVNDGYNAIRFFNLVEQKML